MSKETEENPIGVVNAFMNAMTNGNMDEMVALMHDDMVWDNSGDKNMPWIGPWNGKQAILEQFFSTFAANFQTRKWETTDHFSSGNTAAYFGQMVGFLTNSSKETKEFTFALRAKIKDGKIILWNWFEDSFEVSKVYHSK